MSESSKTNDRDRAVSPLDGASEAVPPAQRDEVEALAQQVAEGGVSRRRFMLRTAQLGIGAGIAGSVLAACGSSGGTTSVADTTAPSGGGSIASKYKNKTIGVGVWTFSDENEPLLAYACEEAADALGLNWKFTVQEMQANQAQVEQVIGSFVTSGVDAIIDIVAPPSLAATQFASAKQKSIPSFGIFTGVPEAPELVFDYGASIGSDAVYMMEYMIRHLRKLHPDENPIKIGVIDSKLEVVKPRRAALNGFLSLPENSDIKMVAEVPDLNQEDIVVSSTEAANAILAEDPDVVAIWTNFPTSAVPIASAITQAGKQDQVGIYGHVAQSPSLEALQQGGTPLAAVSYLDLVYSSWNAIGLMLAHFQDEKRDLRNANLTTNPVPVTCVDPEVAKSSFVQKVPTLGGKEVATWLFQEGSYKEALVRQWSEQFSS